MASTDPRPNPRAERAYADYLALGDGRSLRALIRRYRAGADSPPTRELQTLKRWSSRYHWQARLAAYADEQRRDAEKAEKALVQSWRLKQRRELRELSEKLVEKARLMLEFPLSEVRIEQSDDGKQTTIVMPAGWRMRDAARLVEVAQRVGNLATDQATENVAVSGAVRFREVVAHIPESVRELVDRLGDAGAPDPEGNGDAEDEEDGADY